MTLSVFQSLLVDNIWMLLLLQGIFSEVLVLMLLYSIADHLYGCLSSLRGLFQQFQDPAYYLTFKLSFIVVFFRMVHNKKFFRRSIVKYQTISEGPSGVIYFPYIVRKSGCSTIRNFSEGPALSIRPFQKVQREVIYFPYIIRENKKPL